MEQEAVVIRAVTKRNARTFTLVGGIALISALCMFIASRALMGPGMVCFIFGMIFTVLGIAKWMQPEVSIELRPRGLVYHHHRGSIYLEWDNIQRVDIPRSIQTFDSHDLPYIGVRLKSLLPLIDDIPPRLATGLLSEQRPLLISSLNLDGELADLEHYLNSEFTPITLEGTDFSGVQAMFARRCAQLNTQLGYHVYLPEDCLDRAPREFLALLREYRSNLSQ
ncbi:DUF2982 domain-containing protein [Shewanella sp. KCT]|uniref:DUF2982 domain-containing protein n=1 Tax=Shewanella sp. KCT TaxID=2569535 RepID=UPI0011822AEA|nr:DUF2982 domain-containing protein [Shewanella sp. KCT]TVP10627.1 hypothetical protein AYI87_17900 [Shewanella sp. KCT]